MFTLEIHGVAIAVTDATAEIAQEIFASDDFMADLAEFTTEGRNIWDGKSELKIRPALADETEVFEEALDGSFDDEFTDEDGEEDLDEEDGPNIVFLIDVDQFEEDDEA